MNQRIGNLLIAGLMVLVALWVATMFYGLGWEGFCGPARGSCEMGGCQTCHATWPGSAAGIAAWAGGALVVLGGLWGAWRVGSGHWGLRRRTPAAEPTSGGAGA